VLQDIEKKYQDQPLTVLALSVDGKEGQPKIPDYLKKNNLNSRVLLAGEDGVEGYEFEAASSLFVVDRKGMLAGTPGQYYYKLEEELNRRLPGLLAGQPSPGPLLWGIRKAPPGFGELWHVPVGASASDIAIAPGSGDRSSEIGVLDEAHHFKRYSSRGVLLSDVELDSKVWGLSAVDLDGDGTVEWIAVKEKGFEVLDPSGKSYWKYSEYSAPSMEFAIGGFADVDGDGRKEIILLSGDEVSALRSVPKLLWKNRTLHDVRMLNVDPRGRIWVQTGATVRRLKADGSLSSQSFQAPGTSFFLGEGWGPASSHPRYFGFRYFGRVDRLQHDLDGDGKSDLVIATQGGMVAYAQDGTTLLNLFIEDNQLNPPLALADIDGKPGEELLIFLPTMG